MLLKFLNSIKNMLKPGGVVIGIIAGCNENDHIPASGVYKKDANGVITMEFSSEFIEEFGMIWFTEIDETQGVNSKVPCMFIKKQTYERAFKEVGFSNVDLYKAILPASIENVMVNSMKENAH